MSVTDVIPEHGELEVRIEAFEDRRARWRLPIWEIARLQFVADSPRASRELLAQLERAVERFDQVLVVQADAGARSETTRRIERERAVVRGSLRNLGGAIDLAGSIERREGDHRLYDALEQLLAERGLDHLDRCFSQTIVSNPGSGEFVKGHAIVLAEPTLYRAAAVDGPLPARSQASFVSCTFSECVAAAHFAGGPTTQTAAVCVRPWTPTGFS